MPFIPCARLSLIGALAASFGLPGGMAAAQGAHDAALALDAAAFTPVQVTLDGASLLLRRYDVVYAGKPVALAATQPAMGMGPGGSPSGSEGQVLADLLAYQKMAVFVPEGASDDAAIILNVNNGGWFASALRPGIEEGGAYRSDSDTDKVGAALAAGHVYVDLGSRGRGLVGADGSFPGKAPAAVVDAKAAIRWLRLNDAELPGSAERIVITGTSGGGGLSAVVAASGNSPDYLPFLAEIGAAGIAADGTSSLRDDVFAVIAYCPITDLGHADMAYEWLYQGVRTSADIAGQEGSAAAQAASSALAAGYPGYLAGLGLKDAAGEDLTADRMTQTIATALRTEVERHLAAGGSVPTLGQPFALTVRHGRDEVQVEVANDWLDVREGAVASLDLEAFLRFVAATSPLKAVPAFDRTANTGNSGVDGENTLFGPTALAYANFTPWGWDNNEVPGDGSGIDDTGQDWAAWTAGEGAAAAEQLRLVNPLAWFGTDATTAPHWYIRHGMIDRDTAFAVPLALAAAARQDPEVAGVDFRLPWMVAHSGNYDVQEAYGWLGRALAQAGPVD